MLRCRAEASPAPVYTWLHRTQARPGSEGGQVEIMASRDGDLELTDIGYLEAGEYRCRATNTVGGAERSTESEVISVQVGGASPDLTGNVVMCRCLVRPGCTGQ